MLRELPQHRSVPFSVIFQVLILFWYSSWTEWTSSWKWNLVNSVYKCTWRSIIELSFSHCYNYMYSVFLLPGKLGTLNQNCFARYFPNIHIMINNCLILCIRHLEEQLYDLKTKYIFLYRYMIYVCIDKIRVLMIGYANFVKCNQNHFIALNNMNVKMLSCHIWTWLFCSSMSLWFY